MNPGQNENGFGFEHGYSDCDDYVNNEDGEDDGAGGGCNSANAQLH